MSSAKRTIEIPVRQAPVDLPLHVGMQPDGAHANIVTDAKGVSIGKYFGILNGMTVEQARQDEFTAKKLEALEYMVNAVNAYETLVGALKLIYSAPPNRRAGELAAKALKAAGELKE
jgi:L-aminopeptidase/D-esterase-like protein